MESNKPSARSVRKNIHPRSFTIRVQTQGKKTEGKDFPGQTEQTRLKRHLVNSFLLGD